MIAPSGLWQRELAEFTGRRRALAVKLAYPAVVATMVLWGGAPRYYAAMVLTVLLSTLGALGTGATLAQERGSGIQLRYRLLPTRPSRLLLERVAAFATIDAVQFLPVLALVALRHPGGFQWWIAVVLAAAGALLAANALGALAGSLTSRPAEIMLYVLIPLLPAFYLSGLFVPPSGGIGRLVARILPFGGLHQALTGALGGAAPTSPVVVALVGAAWVALGGLACLALGRRVLEAD